MNSYTMSIFLSSLSAGTIITISSYHWFLAWVGLEINTMAIIPLMIKPHHPRATEAATKYFLTQASASALILFSSLINAWTTGEWTIMEIQNPLSSIMITTGLAIKLGLAPFHMWLPDVLQGLDKMTCLILSTWQKIAPMALIIQLNQCLNFEMLTIMAILSTVLGGWGGLNQPQMRKIMAYSSIAHLGWMIMILPFSTSLTLLNFMIYLTMTSMMFMTFFIIKSNNINMMSISWIKSPVMTALLMTTLLSLGGLPPLSGFMPKWLIIQELVKQNMVMMATIIALSSLISLFFYLRLSYSISLTTPPTSSNFSLSWRLKPQTLLLTSYIFALSTMLLPMTPLMLNIMI
uniref:NADH-ubiquinone oxidoreductase chain 2 n=1 Tax=Siren intermedia texana TaxID=1303107 RepID=A0A343A0G8_SIRIN|nr:NADH dehydrogenase subunit 2 [Siren intermedia texana]